MVSVVTRRVTDTPSGPCQGPVGASEPGSRTDRVSGAKATRKITGASDVTVGTRRVRRGNHVCYNTAQVAFSRYLSSHLTVAEYTRALLVAP